MTLCDYACKDNAKTMSCKVACLFLDVEAEMHNVAVFDDVVFAFDA